MRGGAARAGRASVNLHACVLTQSTRSNCPSRTAGIFSWPSCRCQASQDTAHSPSVIPVQFVRGVGSGLHLWIAGNAGRRRRRCSAVTYTESVLNGPLRGLAKETNMISSAQRAVLEDTELGDDRVGPAYLELVKVLHSLELLRKRRRRRTRLWTSRTSAR